MENEFLSPSSTRVHITLGTKQLSTLWRQRKSQATVTLVSGRSLRSGEPAFQRSLCAGLTASLSQPFHERFINLLVFFIFFGLKTLFNKSFEVLEQLRKCDSAASKDEQPNRNRTISKWTFFSLAGPGWAGDLVAESVQ